MRGAQVTEKICSSSETLHGMTLIAENKQKTPARFKCSLGDLFDYFYDDKGAE